MTPPLPPYTRATPANLPRIVAVGFRRINKLLQDVAPEFVGRAVVEVLDVGFEQAVTRLSRTDGSAPDVVVAAGSNGAYLRQRLDMPVVLVKVGGFDLMRALAQASKLSREVGLVTYEGMAPDLAPFASLFDLHVHQRSYHTEDEAHACVRELRQAGVPVVVGSGVAADVADQLGLSGVFLYSSDAVREALEDALEVARAARIEQAKRERLSTILAQLSDGVIAVDASERIQTLNPTMAQWLGIEPEAWQGRRLSDVCPELSLQSTLRLGLPDRETIERVRGKALIVNRVPLIEQGQLAGAVLSCQDPISIQRVDRHIRARIKSQTALARHELSDFLGNSPLVQGVQDMARSCARSQATVLLIGESGTGKELIAQGIHTASERRDMPFVAVNCAALSETLLESELFGYEDGAFTGARKGGKIGLFEAAHNGTIFLDEVGEMPLSLQARLLRVLQAREVLRVGATEPTVINVRVIAATHRNLMAHVAQGLFRLDLYYRLNILRLEVPPLRDRLDDIATIAQTLAEQVCGRLQLDAQRVAPLMNALIERAPAYAWPGNVRELDNLIERLMAYAGPACMHGTPTIEEARVRLAAVAPELYTFDARVITASAPVAVTPILLTGLPHGEGAPVLPDFAQTSGRTSNPDQAAIREAVTRFRGDKTAAARELGISRTTLWRRLREG